MAVQLWLVALGDLLETVRAVVTNVREKQEAPEFRQPGWILHPRTLDELTRSPVDDTLDKYRLLGLDGADEALSPASCS